MKIGGTHTFHTAIAMKIGIEAAIILENIFFWCKKNEANEKHFHHGKTWTYNSIEAFHKLFPYMSKYSIRKALIDLEKSGYVITGNFNKISYDQTKWYAVTEKVSDDFDKKSEQNDSEKIENSICPKLKMDYPKTKNGILILDKPIPGSKPGSKISDSKPLKDSRQKISPESIISLWNKLAKENELPSVSKLTPSRKSKILSRCKSPDLSSPTDWKNLFDKIPNCPFLLGDGNTGWKVSFDWLVHNDENYVKVLEGLYDEKKKKTPKIIGTAKPQEGKYKNILRTVVNSDTGRVVKMRGEEIVEVISEGRE